MLTYADVFWREAGGGTVVPLLVPLYMCPHTGICVLGLLYVCPYATACSYTAAAARLSNAGLVRIQALTKPVY